MVKKFRVKELGGRTKIVRANTKAEAIRIFARSEAKFKGNIKATAIRI